MTDLYQAPLVPGSGVTGSMLAGNYGPTNNPFFTSANQFLPRNLHDVIKWARYITMQSPTTTEVIRKLSTYPITDFVVDTNSEKVKARYSEIFTSFRLKSTLHSIGFDYYTLGNVFVSVFFPIVRTLTCKCCNVPYNAKAAEFTTFKQFGFHGKCPKCNHVGEFEVSDAKSLNVADMNIIKWDPLNIVVNYNPFTGEYEYYYKIPNDVKRRIQSGDKLFVNSVPWALIEAVKNNQDFKFDNDKIYHLKNISAGHQIGGIAVPPLISLYSLVYYQATLRKANEAISSDFMSPLRVVYPQAQTGQSDPVVSISMRNFVSNMQDAIIKQRRDKSHVLIAPVPVGYQAISGEGRNLLVSQEIQQAEETILLSLGVSRELLSGVTNWTSSTVGLRLLENSMLIYNEQIMGFVNWAMSSVAKYLGLESCKITLTPFKLTDDDALRQLLAQLVAQGGVSMSTFYEACGMDYDKDLNKQREDAIAKAVNDAKTKMESDRAVFMATKDIQDQFDKESEYKNALAKAQPIAQQLSQSDPNTQMTVLNQLMINDYAQYALVSRLMEEYAANAQTQPQVGPDGQPVQDGQDEQEDQSQQDSSGAPGQDQNQDQKQPAQQDKQDKKDKPQPK